MSRYRLLSVAAALAGAVLSFVSLAALPEARGWLRAFASSSQTYANPVIGTDFADPAVIHGRDGWYYA